MGFFSAKRVWKIGESGENIEMPIEPYKEELRKKE